MKEAHHPIIYRPDIDGLRAIAVLSVLFFHAGIGFPGGYVGVDVFFVISGFLITSIILKDLQNGSFSLAGFWERRARRILPASLFVCLATLAAGWFLLLPWDFKSLGASVIAQALFCSNIFFYKATDYFADNAEELPLLHTWSLSVEEQFYFILPLLLLLFFRTSFLKSRFVWSILLGGGLVLSLGASVYGTSDHPSATFYLLPTRAWELLSGSLVAFMPTKHYPQRPWIRETLAWLGLAGVLVPAFTYDTYTPFPGLAAIPPCWGASILILSNAQAGEVPALSTVGRLLALRPLTFIGLVSYSLYLWHWPLLVYFRYLDLNPSGPSLILRLAVVLASFTLAILSWKFIETPFRKKFICQKRSSVFIFAGTGTAALALCGLVLLTTNGLPLRYTSDLASCLKASNDGTKLNRNDTASIIRGKASPIGIDSKNAPIEWLVWGDSHAGFTLPAMHQFLLLKQQAGRSITHPATLPVLDFYLTTHFGLNKEAIPWGHAVLEYTRSHGIKNMLIVGRWSSAIAKDPQNFQTAFKDTIRQFNAIGVTVYVLLQVPEHAANVPKALALESVSSKKNNPHPWQKTEEEWKASNQLMYKLAQELESSQCHFIDPAPYFLDPDTGHYIVLHNDTIPLYRDSHHLTRSASLEILLPILQESLPSH